MILFDFFPKMLIDDSLATDVICKMTQNIISGQNTCNVQALGNTDALLSKFPFKTI